MQDSSSDPVGWPGALAGHGISILGEHDFYGDVAFKCSCGENGDGYILTEAICNVASHLLGEQTGR